MQPTSDLSPACVVLLATFLMLAASPAPSAAAPDCLAGSYRLADGSDVDVASVDGALRWRRFDGSTGSLHPQPDGTYVSNRGWSTAPDGIVVAFDACGGGGIRFAGTAGSRVDFEVHDVTFESHNTPLAGRLVLPRGAAKVPIAVLIHGSEHDSALATYSLQRMLPSQGIGAFVYDKRGTGASGGIYTQDYSLLADDAVAAVSTARSLAAGRAGRVGFQGGSQAGWVVPLAATRTPVDFAIVCFGLAVNALEEDQQAVEIQLSEKGYTAAEIRDALTVARAAEQVFVSGFTDGFAELDRLRSRYSTARWYKDLRGDFTWAILPKSKEELIAMAPEFNWHTPWTHDPMPVLRRLRTPQLWILGGEDYEAPSRESRRRLQSLIAHGSDITVAYYRNAEHGMTLFELDARGERISTGYAPGYFRLIRDFAAHGALSGIYGDAVLTRPAPRR